MFELNVENKKNYTIKSEKRIEEQVIDAVELIHNKTKAKVILFMCEDENRVFNIAFKTPVKDSKGKPHILEHSVLCGSRKYDVKDPFIQLARSSMNTFLNAITYPDKTCYPVASANIKDFHNLVDVYLDAVFYPNVIKNEKLFRQEGWHYELNNKNDELKVNGVVYNEMKGMFSDPQSRLQSEIYKTLYKGTNYENESGGLPKEIIDLSYDEFVDFYKEYYSASNSIIYYYGKLDYNEELNYLNEEYLSKQEYVKCDINIDDAKKCKDKELVVSTYNFDAMNNKDKSYIGYSFLLDYEKNALNDIAMQIIDYVLFSSDGAILHEKCQKNGYGESVYSMVDSSIKKGIYSIVAQNIDSAKKDSFIKLIDDSIIEIIENGLDKDKIKAALNYIYFNYAEGEYGSEPKGLTLILNSLSTYLYGLDYDTYIKYVDEFKFLNSVNLDDKNNFFIKLMKEVFVNNRHRCINILNPDKNFEIENEKETKEKLAKRKSKLTEEEIDNEIKKCDDLKKFQQEEDLKENYEKLPKLNIKDIDRDKKLIDYCVKTIDGVETIISNDNDKDIIYLNISFDVTNLQKGEIYLLTLIIDSIGKLNLSDETFQEFNNYVGANTGGYLVKNDIYNDSLHFTYEIKVSEKKLDIAFDIFYKLMTKVIFEDKERINIVINESKAESLNILLANGHISAGNRSRANDVFSCYYLDKISNAGVGYNQFINKLASKYDANSDLINKTLGILYNKVLSEKMYFEYCANSKYDEKVTNAFKVFYKKVKNFLSFERKDELDNNIKKIDSFIAFDDFDKKVKAEAIVTPNDVNFCAMSGSFDKNIYNGRFKLLKIIFNYEYLWNNIRVLGGAYGCMFNSTRLGDYIFASYRDPNLSKTNAVFKNVKKFIENFDKNNDEVEKYIIATMGTIDNPVTTISRFKRNIGAYFNNFTNDLVNEERHEILDTKASDIKELSKMFDNFEKTCNMCAFITEKDKEEAKSEYDSVWSIIK